MCLIVFAYDCHPRYRLILGANRDEFRSRPAEPARFWSDAPHIIAGRDRQAGGTWLGVTTFGKFAAVTNYRDPRQHVIAPPSRGNLVADYLLDPVSNPSELRAFLNREGERYDGFNLLYGDSSEFHYFTNRGGSSGPVTPGVHGLSNHLLDTRWAKVTVAKSRLDAVVRHDNIDPVQILEALSDPVPFADSLLPDTGVGLERERLLSPIFIGNEEYGTRSSTVVLIERNNCVTFVERVFGYPCTASSTLSHTFRIQPMTSH